METTTTTQPSSHGPDTLLLLLCSDWSILTTDPDPLQKPVPGSQTLTHVSQGKLVNINLLEKIRVSGLFFLTLS